LPTHAEVYFNTLSYNSPLPLTVQPNSLPPCIYMYVYITSL